MLRAYFGDAFAHSPERSGLPSGARGGAAARFGLPSLVRGMRAVGLLEPLGRQRTARGDDEDGGETCSHGHAFRERIVP